MLEDGSDTVKRVRLVVELAGCPYKQQEQILDFIVDRLPRFRRGAHDANGNGAYTMSGRQVTPELFGTGTTANLVVRSGKVYPARGSYASLVYLDGKWRGAALNIGYDPTFEGVRGLRCETYITDFSGDLYDRSLVVFPFARNREEMKFPGPAELKEQLEKDAARVRSLAAGYIAGNGAALKKFEPLIFDM